METIFSSIVLSISTNLDNLTIGIVYSFKNSQINFAANLAIALLSGISTFASMSLGDWIHQLLMPNLANGIGSIVLILIGCGNLAQILQRKFALAQQTSSSDISNSNISTSNRAINFKEAIYLGLALTITNLGTGIGAGIAQLDIILTSSLSFVSSLITIALGTLIGKAIASIFSSNKLEFVAGLLLITLGVYEYIL